MNDQRPRDGYTQTRSTMRTLGPILMVVGGVLALIGVIDFFTSFFSIASHEPFSTPSPSRFPILFPVLGFPGLLLLGIGGKLTKAGYLREITQYAAKETTPAVMTTTTAIRAAITDDDIPCPGCSRPIEPDSKFCPHCGIRISGGTCSICQATLEAGDRFCASCGNTVGDNPTD